MPAPILTLREIFLTFGGDALLDGLARGRVDAIATDHSPHTREEKVNADIWKAVSGFAGVELSVRLWNKRQKKSGDCALNCGTKKF